MEAELRSTAMATTAVRHQENMLVVSCPMGLCCLCIVLQLLVGKLAAQIPRSLYNLQERCICDTKDTWRAGAGGTMK